MKFLQAKSFSRAERKPGAVTLVVIHTMEAPEGAATAENVASWFAGPSAPQASAHYNVDGDSVVQSVHEKDIAWHAGPVNGFSIGIEHAGYAKQTPEGWADAYSIAMLERSAELVADICRRHNIPVERVTDEDLKAGKRHGICGHVDVTVGLTGGRGHWDPGPHFPWDWYLERVRSRMKPMDDLATPLVDESRFVEVVLGPERWLVSPLMIGPTSIAGAKAQAEAMGCQLPTPALVDAIWRQADLRISPAETLQAHDGTSAGMNAPEVYDRVRQGFERELSGRSYPADFELLAGGVKDVIEVDGRVGLYGLHVEDVEAFTTRTKARLGVTFPTQAPATPGAGRVVQPPFFGHAGAWKDYSQFFRPVRRG